MRGMQKRLLEKELTVFPGKMLSLRPFFITCLRKKEIFLYLCKMFLNAKLLFEPSKTLAKKDGNVYLNSITEYFMPSCGCPKFKK